MKTLSRTPHRREDQRQWLRIFLLAVISRLALLLAMSTSSAIIPDLHPGDDVLQFNLRLENPKDAADNTCFCLKGHACDLEVKRRRHTTVINDSLCADADDNIKRHIDTRHRYNWLDRFYSFILPPITKWDAARFLTLSVDPWARYLQHPFIEQTTCNNVDDDSSVCNATTATADELFETALQKSEKAHAFFPLLPLMIRYAANCIINVVPLKFLPSTYEATVALTAIIINILAFAIAAVSLYDLTIFMCKRNELSTTKDETIKKAIYYRDIAKTTSELFCINPAGVFFTSAYSESVFAMLTFVGHAVAVRGLFYSESVHADTKSNRSRYYMILSTLLWALASYARSNGTFTSIWLMLIGIGKCCSYIYNKVAVKQQDCVSARAMAVKCASILCGHSIMALAVAVPVFYHDKRGHDFHCMDSNGLFDNPEWCHRHFSLYAHVQRKHWNVGLLRYYELKQLPNFILAMPVLSLSFGAAALWIKTSWTTHIKCDKLMRKRCLTLKNMLWWVFRGFSSSYSSEGSIPSVSKSTPMLLGPPFLPYYAILTGFALVGTFVAHVQISTRLICSSCPAFYWFVNVIILESEENNRVGEQCIRRKLATYLPKGIWFYFGLYNLLGVIMHVNWLPWT